MQRSIDTVAVLGAGTMGAGIAAACAQAGSRVHLLDLDGERVAGVLAKMTEGRAPMLDDPAALDRISAGSLDDLSVLADCDWICEAVVEDLGIKQELFRRVERAERRTTGAQALVACRGGDRAVLARVAEQPAIVAAEVAPLEGVGGHLRVHGGGGHQDRQGQQGSGNGRHGDDARPDGAYRATRCRRR